MQKRGVFNSKRAVATEILIEAMEALAIILILSGTLTYVNNQMDKSGLAKRFYVRDMALLSTAVYSAQGNLAYFYYIDTVDDKNPDRYKFDFLISNNTVRVNATNSARPLFYWYFSDANMQGISYEENNRLGIVKFIKEGDQIKIGLSPVLNKQILLCPSISTEDTNWKSRMLVIDPMHGENATDKGAINPEDITFFESYLTYRLAENIGGASGQNKVIARKENEYTSVQKRQEVVNDAQNKDADIIAIKTGNDIDTSKNYIKAYYNMNSDAATKLKSRKLGCSILNEILYYEKLSNRDKINGVALIPSDSSYITKIIPAGRVGVMLELGNMQIIKKDSFLADTTSLAEAIGAGRGNYYSR